MCYHYLVIQPHPLIGMKGLLMYAALNPHEFGTLYSIEYIDYMYSFLTLFHVQFVSLSDCQM